MTEAEFSELIDLYLDEEISPDQLILLKAELSKNRERRKLLAERWRLHQATREVLAPAQSGKLSASADRSSRRSAGRRRSGKTSRTAKRSVRRAFPETRVYPQRVVLPGWIGGTGLAISLFLSVVLLRPVFLDTVDTAALPELAGVRQSELAVTGSDPAEVRPSDFERYRKRQEAEALQHASLVAQMRLLGLRPEHTPTEKRLQTIRYLQPASKQNSVTQAELLARLQSIQPMPKPELLRSEDRRGFESIDRLGGGFETRLVGY